MQGFDVLIRAFLTEFVREDNVELYILTSAYHSTSDFDSAVRKMIREAIRCRGTPEDMCLTQQQIDSRELPAIRLLRFAWLPLRYC